MNESDQSKTNLRVIFTNEADLAFEELIKKFNLEESLESFTEKNKIGKPFNINIINSLIKSFAKQNISEKDMIVSLQKDLELSLQVTEQIVKDIIKNIIPHLEIIPEEKFKDPNFTEEISEKMWKNEKEKKQAPPRIKPLINISDVIEKENPLMNKNLKTGKDIDFDMLNIKKDKKIKKPKKEPAGKDLPPKPKQPQQKGPDSYREPIE
jgi:hypothetical protein